MAKGGEKCVADLAGISGERLERALRAEAALDSTYARGSQIARSGGVLSCLKREGGIGSTVSLTGRVKGSGGSYYAVTVDLDLETTDVLDYSCTCPAASKYAGMCKHEIALALSLAAAPASSDKRPLQPETSCGPRPCLRASAQALPEAPTTPALDVLLARSARERLGAATVGRASRQRKPEPVRLLVTLGFQEAHGSAGTILVKLGVQRGRARYVVRSVAALVDACRQGAEVSYGKNLTFVHVREAFEPRSWRVIEVLSRVVDAQSALFDSRWGYREAGRGADVRSLPLSAADAIALLDALQGATVAVEPPAGSGHYHVQGDDVPVCYGDPVPVCAITRDRQGGLVLSTTNDLRLVCSEDACYVLGPSRAWRTSDEFAKQAAPVLCALSQSRGTAHVSSRDVPEFCRSVLPALRSWTELSAPEDLGALVPEEPSFLFKVGMDEGQVTCEARVSYGDWSCALGASERPGQPARDLATEYHVADVLDDYFPLGERAPDAWSYRFGEDDEELLLALLTDGLAELAGLGEVFVSERLRSISVRPAPSLSVRATVRSGLLDVQLGASGMTERELIEYLEGLRLRQRFVRLSSGDIVRLGSNAHVAEQLASGLGVTLDALAAGEVGLPSARAILIDGLLDHVEGVRLERDAGFRRVIRDFDSYADADIEVPQGLCATLRGYQEDGFRWLSTLERLGFGGILADDMGLGKTLQVIAHILSRKEAGEKGTTLVVCPASLVYNWMSELARFAPGLKAAAVVGPKAARRALIGDAMPYDMLVTSYDLLRRDVEDYEPVTFLRVVLDEAQYVKNPRTQVARAAKCLDASHRLALTGTPIENRTDELWSIFDFLMPGYLGTRDEFAKRYEGPVEAADRDGQRLLRCAIGPFVLRRLKADVLADLPEKTESVVFSQMGTKQERLYLATQDRLALQVQHRQDRDLAREKLKVLAELTRLRQICCDPNLYLEGWDGESAKLDTCLELVAQAVDAGHKVLLFSQFTSMLDILAAHLAAAHVRYFQLTGATSKESRERLVRRFQAGEADVFLISLKAGGVGLNLTAADVVIHYDPWWNVAAQNQATDRAHRIGQRRDVTVFKLICKGTIEERILKMQEAKRGLAESVLGGEAVASATLTREDILALLGQAGYV